MQERSHCKKPLNTVGVGVYFSEVGSVEAGSGI